MIEAIAIIVTIVVGAIPYIWKKYFTRPQNTVEIRFTGGSKRTERISPNNPRNASSYRQNLIHVFNLTWNFELVIRNNSDVESYYTNLEILSDLEGNLNILNQNDLNTIPKNEEIILSCNYRQQIEATPSQSPNMRSLPDEFDSIEILLSYKNSKSTEFYTLFRNNSENPNSFLRNRPN